MKKVILLILILTILSNAKPLIFDVCKNWCFQYTIEDVRTWKWMTNEVNGERFIRITYLNGNELDLNLGGYEVKVRK